MVDPNPGRGMPLQLQRYWLGGKGAAKIRWGMPHDFNRCVRNLRKYFPKNPKGLCNILHQKALGAPPGKGHPGEHSIIASLTFSTGTMVTDLEALTAAQKLMDKQPKLGQYLWAGPLAPIGRPTMEPREVRLFEQGALRHRMLPLPLDWREREAPGHTGSMTVGRILGIAYGPDHEGQEHAWGWGDYLDEEIIPESRKARYLMEMGVSGASVDPGGRIIGMMDPETGVKRMAEFTIGGATLVRIPAFSGTQLYSITEDGDWPDDDLDLVMPLEEEMADVGDCGCADRPAAILASGATFTVNSSGWRGLPLAPRDAVFDNDDAVKRITAWANVNAQGADVDKLRRAFMWYDPNLSPTDPTSYRLPVGDVINGNLTLVYHAIYAAAALLSGAHGGLPGIDENDRNDLRNVISEIYPEMAKEFNDSSIRAPWDRSAQPGVQMSMEFAATEPYGDVTYADPGYRENKKRYPIDTPEHIRAAWSYINVPKNHKGYTPEQVETIKGRIKAAAEKAGVEISSEEMSIKRKKRRMSEDTYNVTYPVEPPRAWFDNPKLPARTPVQVTPDGQVFGHIAAWGECHRDFAGRECVLAPRSRKGYEPFHLGTVYTAEGTPVRVGKIVMDTRHADIGLGYTAAAVHYDDTGDEIAVVRAGEDEYGIWVAGSVVPEATPKKVAKLRRSPISGDWRRVEGALELTAALAVNVPAFPVYAMDGEEQLALVAAGSLDPLEIEEPPTGIVPLGPQIGAMIREAVREVFTAIEEHEGQEELATRFDDLLEDEEIYSQRNLEERFSALTAAVQPPEPVPAPATVPVVPPGQAPVPAPAPEAGQVEGGQTWPPDPATMLQLMMDARYSIIEEPDGDQVPVSDAGATPGVTPPSGSATPAAGAAPPQPQAQV